MPNPDGNCYCLRLVIAQSAYDAMPVDAMFRFLQFMNIPATGCLLKSVDFPLCNAMFFGWHSMQNGKITLILLIFCNRFSNIRQAFGWVCASECECVCLWWHSTALRCHWMQIDHRISCLICECFALVMVVVAIVSLSCIFPHTKFCPFDNVYSNDIVHVPQPIKSTVCHLQFVLLLSPTSSTTPPRAHGLHVDLLTCRAYFKRDTPIMEWMRWN